LACRALRPRTPLRLDIDVHAMNVVAVHDVNNFAHGGFDRDTMAGGNEHQGTQEARIMLGLLESVERDGGQTQRRLASELGVALGLGAAFTYSVYILSSDGVASRVPALTLATLVCTGAAASLTIGSFVAGQLHPGEVTLAGWGWLVCIAAVSTVGAITLFFAGLSRVGPTSASILSTFEPVVTVVLAAGVLAEHLTSIQVAGGALVLTAVLVLRVVPQQRLAHETA